MSELKASDLRLDNLVYGPLNEICQVKQLGNSLFPNLVGYRELNNLKSWGQNGQRPISVTEEWLVKFGAENIRENQYRIGNRLFILRNGYWVDYGTSVILKYVHQLQNLYFALTKEELTFV